MTLGNDRIKKKFDDIDDQIDLMIECCQSLQSENKALLLKIETLKADLDGKTTAETDSSEQEAIIQSKIEGLFLKLDTFSTALNRTESSSL
jgi:cell division septum initiation protein DivIVA